MERASKSKEYRMEGLAGVGFLRYLFLGSEAHVSKDQKMCGFRNRRSWVFRVQTIFFFV